MKRRIESQGITFPLNLVMRHELIRFTLALTPSLSPGKRVIPSAGRECFDALVVITAFVAIAFRDFFQKISFNLLSYEH